MGRTASKKISASVSVALSGILTKSSLLPGFLGIFGAGRWSIYYRNGSFKVPKGVTKIRVRVVGAGGAGRTNSYGGAGGGYAHGVFDVIPEDTYTVTVGTGGTAEPLVAGGASSFGNLISATGGTGGEANNSTTPPVPGIGVGGDFRSKGGISVRYGGGGAAGSQLGDGGSSLAETAGGGGVGGNNAYSRAGASAFNGSKGGLFPGMSYRGVVADDTVGNSASLIENIDSISRFPFDCFIGGGGYSGKTGGAGAVRNGGSGAGGEGGRDTNSTSTTNANGGAGGFGGGGGAGYAISAAGNRSFGGKGGIGGGGGGGRDSLDPSLTTNSWAEGGPGIVIIEW